MRRGMESNGSWVAHTMSNPNNCNTCKHKPDPDGAWCYMFKDEPKARCAHHSGRDCYTIPYDELIRALGKRVPR